MDQMDERQQQVRGKIAMQALIGMIVYLLLAAFLNDFGVIDIEHHIGCSNFLIFSVVLLLSFLSVSLILRDAYIGVAKNPQLRICLGVFTALAVFQDVLFIFDQIRGEGVTLVSVSSLILVNSVSICLWIKRKDWK